jgi:small-conductance mechanosensitive channel
MRLHHYHHYPWDAAPQWAEDLQESLNLLNQKMEIVMTDTATLKAAADRLQASDTAALAALQGLKDQNTALAAQLAAVQTGDPTTQAAIDAVVTELTSTADTVDKAVAANAAVPNLSPSPTSAS